MRDRSVRVSPLTHFLRLCKRPCCEMVFNYGDPLRLRNDMLLPLWTKRFWPCLGYATLPSSRHTGGTNCWKQQMFQHVTDYRTLSCYCYFLSFGLHPSSAVLKTSKPFMTMRFEGWIFHRLQVKSFGATTYSVGSGRTSCGPQTHRLETVRCTWYYLTTYLHIDLVGMFTLPDDTNTFL
jgi:hypothetical protein